MSDLYKVRITGRFEGTREQVVARCLARGNKAPDLDWHLRSEDGRFVELELLAIDVHPDAGIWFDPMFVFRLVAEGIEGKSDDNPLYALYGGWRATNDIYFEPPLDGRNPVWLSGSEYVEEEDFPRGFLPKEQEDDIHSPTAVRYTVVLPKKLAPTLVRGREWSSTAYPGAEHLQYPPRHPAFSSSYVERGYRALAFDGDRVWAAAQKGALVSWDSGTLRPKRERTPSEGEIVALAVDGKRALWVFDNQMLIARREPNGQWEAVRNRALASTQKGREFGPVVTSPGSGRIWVATPKAVLELESPLQWRAFPTLKPVEANPEGPHTGVHSMAVHPDGSLWVGLLGGGVERLDAKSHQSVSFAKDTHAPSEEPWFATMVFTRDGTLWGSIQKPKGQVFTRTSEGQWAPARKAPRFPSEIHVSQRHEEIWIGGSNGLFRCNAKGQWSRFRAGDGKGLRSSNIMSITEDGEGRIWVGTDEGVYRQAGPNAWESLDFPGRRIARR
jgi:ligand-binding sensor domain-containing protein